MYKHPFTPIISENAKKLLIGTLPPEKVNFYFSNSSNTRLWDILYSLSNDLNKVSSGSNNFSNEIKIEILKELKLGITDIVLEYERDYMDSTKDSHINPKAYNNLLKIAYENNIDELLFVYNNAYKWFLHSLENEKPVKINKLKGKLEIGLQREVKVKEREVKVKERIIKCFVLPSPLNRGRKGETLDYKLGIYKKNILD